MAPKYLPRDLMEVQIGEVDLLKAMYASDEELHMDDASQQLLESLRHWCESDGGKLPELEASAISVLLNLCLDEADEMRDLQLGISVPVVFPHDEGQADDDTEPPKAKVWIRQSTWMSKAEAARLTDEIPNEDILSAIEFAKEAASQLLLDRAQQRESSSATPTSTEASMVRIWFYFPSISTRVKRDDIVHHAPSYGLTGFLLAGKPGILCLEGGSQAIDDYMKFIKTESWKDIPSQHKKVSERYRQAGIDVTRVFDDMQEITDEFGDTRRGARGNRNDMSVLKAWLDEHGVGDAFEKVFI
ncbi:uncharacterized protein F5Z01DRAFT_674864 [Emericellopsis atlantica]|uniref:Small nuclear ribonucleoprotein Prp3 C-terminal domain-containing protein n=1 Tax=Emericellopsis atlantica TaxID=2614577 RepID=A0A9P8CNE9_9HYPO|nr:uncharacterized protein F5Z01DRAFT_674864 [Emericellopsis atlantica]KAG9253453.1 hypothetical protein F5Z01DRAFT_674864 [Emericellopsis atlantica]